MVRWSLTCLGFSSWLEREKNANISKQINDERQWSISCESRTSHENISFASNGDIVGSSRRLSFMGFQQYHSGKVAEEIIDDQLFLPLNSYTKQILGITFLSFAYLLPSLCPFLGPINKPGLGRDREGRIWLGGPGGLWLAWISYFGTERSWGTKIWDPRH